MAKSEIVDPLSTEEKAAFDTLVGKIKQWIKNGFEVGRALAKIRDTRMYREKFFTFEAFTEAEFGFSKSRANQLISASHVAKVLTTAVAKTVHGVQPTNETQVRDLVKFSPMIQAQAWDKAVEIAGGQQPTQSQVKLAAQIVSQQVIAETDHEAQAILDEVLPDTPEEAEAKIAAARAQAKEEEKARRKLGQLDRACHVVPACMIDVFKHADTWSELCHELRQLGRRIASQVKLSGAEVVALDRGIVYCDHDERGNITHTRCDVLNEMAAEIELRAPHSICPECKGLCVVDEKNHCFYCHDRGWLIKTDWEKCDNQDALEVA